MSRSDFLKRALSSRVGISHQLAHYILGTNVLNNLVDDYIVMNQAGLVLELCEKYYDPNVIMLNNGQVFAKSMRESYDKQKGFIGTIQKFTVKLISKKIIGNVSELVFHYKMTGYDSSINQFTGKHIQTWEHDKIIKEEYVSI